ncbi:MAG: ATP-binding cassette domain-containing protein, partial [Bacteroidetes bacterium]|nr:ATP-binding cassette domain-containing protein [Bacteroidota bacterium]
MIEAKDLHLYYGSFHALKGISMKVPEKSVTALIGPSGCGKSTFLRTFNRMNDLIAGVKIEGDVIVDDMNIYEKRVDVDSLRKRVGMVFQKPNPFAKSIYENVAYGLRVNGVNDEKLIKQTIEESLKQAALWDEVKDNLKKSAYALSGGQQ